jgi:single-strand DNA-binding protein
VRLATSERIFNRQTQEAKDHTEWHTVVMWRGLADVVDKYVRKGTQLYIEGVIRSNEWTDREGNKRYGTEIVANEMKLLGGRKDAGAPVGTPISGVQSSGAAASQNDVPWASDNKSGAGARSETSRQNLPPEPIPMDDPDYLPF